jgi:streptogramin lyase
MGQQADNLFVVEVDPQNGASRQFIAQGTESNYPTATLMSRTGILYVGAAYSGRLYRFDPQKDRLEDCGVVNPEKAVFPCAIDEDKEGRLWIGSYGTADLTSFDPRTGDFQRQGRMDEVDMYNYPMVNADGMICCRIAMTKPKCVVFDPKTGKKEVVGPVTIKGKDTFEMRKDGKGWVHIISSLENFRIEGFVAVSEKDAPEVQAAPPFHSIKAVKFVGPEAEPCRKIELQTEKGETRILDVNYQTAGTDIFYVHKGPDGLIYGSSVLPLHLFRYNPESVELVDLGKASSGGGEAYSMANLGGKLYISAYTGAALSVYDPAKPYKFGSALDNNPRDLGRMDEISYRPRTTLAGPLGRVWVASLPDYGLWGGPLSWYDPKTEEKKAYFKIVGEGSCYTLAYLDELDLIAVGTNIQGGTGTLSKVDQAVLFLWDYRAEKKVWEGTMDRKVDAFNALLALPNGKLLGIVTGGDKPEIFLFDPKSRAFEKRADLPQGAPLDLSLQLGPDGLVYGFTKSCLYRLDPETLAVTEIVREENGFDVMGPILGNDVYYARGAKLKAIRLFQEVGKK